MNPIVALAVLLIGLGGVERLSAQSLFNRPETVILEKIKVTGDLAIVIPLGKVEISHGLVIDVYLEHRIQVNHVGDCVSRWIVPVLETGVYPAESRRFRWVSPGSTIVLFDVDSKGLAKANDWRFERRKPSDVRISNQDWILTYERGQLASISGKRGLEIAVSASATRINSLSIGSSMVLAATYTDDGQPDEVTVVGSRFLFRYDGNRLVEVVRVSDQQVLMRAAYRDGMLSSLAANGAPNAELAWQPISNFCRGDSRARFPIHLAQYGGTRYKYKIKGDIVVIEAIFSDTVRRLAYNVVNRLYVTDSVGLRRSRVNVRPRRRESLERLERA